MNGSRFDAWTRRGVSLAAGTLLAGLVPLPGLAKKGKHKNKRKKCKKPKIKCGKKCFPPGDACRFNKKGKRWILCADCTISQTIQLPNGVTLDGNGKTITMSGPKSGYAVCGVAAVVNPGEAGQANVVNLTLDGGGLSEPCSVDGSNEPCGIVFGQTSGRIENVTITNINCTAAILASVDGRTPERTIEVVNSRITADPPPGRGGFGINFSSIGAGRLVAHVSESEFTSAALLFNSNVEATVDGCSLTATSISGFNGAHVTVSNSTITDAGVGVSGESANTVMTVTGNTIVGPDDDDEFLVAGIQFGPGSSGSVSGNAISNYFDDSPGVGCGIRVSADAGDVTIGTNTFPPPGNEQDVC